MDLIFFKILSLVIKWRFMDRVSEQMNAFMKVLTYCLFSLCWEGGGGCYDVTIFLMFFIGITDENGNV